MSYRYNFVVKKTGSMDWTIYNEMGCPLHVLTRCTDKFDVEMRAQAWASSWNSVEVTVIDEQDKLRNKVPSKT